MGCNPLAAEPQCSRSCLPPPSPAGKRPAAVLNQADPMLIVGRVGAKAQ